MLLGHDKTSWAAFTILTGTKRKKLKRPQHVIITYDYWKGCLEFRCIRCKMTSYLATGIADSREVEKMIRPHRGSVCKD